MDLSTLPRAIVRTATPLWARNAVRRYVWKARNGPPSPPTLQNLERNSSYFARKCGLSQLRYFENVNRYNATRSVLTRQPITDDPIVRGIETAHFEGSAWTPTTADEVIAANSLTHLAAIDFLVSRVPRNARILDIACGMRHLFLHLYRFGYTDLTGVDDSSFQPNIITCAREFLDWYRTPVRLPDFRNIGFHGWYKARHLEGVFDVVSLCGLRGDRLFELAYDLLKPGGFFIQETIDVPPGVHATDFSVVAVYPEYGRSDRHPYSTAMYQKSSINHAI
jgi:SAM-dependent methyltransferase